MGSSAFHTFVYARSEQCDLGPIHTITNTQLIRIYPGKLKFILVKISPDPGRLHCKHAKENQILFTFVTIENLSGLLKKMPPGGRILARFIGPGVLKFFARGWGIPPSKKLPGGFA